MHPFASGNRGREPLPRVPETENQLTCQLLSPNMGEHSIKSGGGTGPTMPRQPVRRKPDDQVPIPGPDKPDKDGESALK